MNPRFSPRPFALLMLGLLLIARPLHGAELIEDVQVGIGGKLKLGHWTPVQVQLQSPVTLQGQVEVTVQDGDATDAVFRGPSEVS